MAGRRIIQLRVQPSEVEFPPTIIRTRSTTTIEVTNMSGFHVDLTLSIDGHAFHILSSFDANFHVGETKHYTVLFQPGRVGHHSGSINFFRHERHHDILVHEIRLSGTGISP